MSAPLSLAALASFTLVIPQILMIEQKPRIVSLLDDLKPFHLNAGLAGGITPEDIPEIVRKGFQFVDLSSINSLFITENKSSQTWKQKSPWIKPLAGVHHFLFS